MGAPVKTPDITPAGLASLAVVFASNIIILFGLNISPTKEAALDTLINGAFVVAFLIHDAIIRHGRAKVVAAQITANGAAPASVNAPQVAPRHRS